MRLFLIAILSILLCGCGTKEQSQKVDDKPLSNQDKLAQVSKEIESKPSASSYSKRADLYLSMNENSLALDDVKSAIKLDTANGKLYYQAAEIFRKDSRINASISYAIKATQYGFSEGKVYLLLGENYLIFRKYQAAIDNLNEAMRLDRFNEKIYFLKGMVYKESQQYDEAQSSFQTAIELTPQYAEAYNQLVSLALKNKNYEVANTYLESGLRFNPTDAFLWFNKGVFLQEQGYLDSAIVPYLTSIRYDSSITLASFNLAYIYNSKQEYENSIKEIDKVLSLKPNDVQSLYMNALNYEALDDKEKAVEYLKKSLRVNPDHKPSAKLYEKLK